MKQSKSIYRKLLKLFFVALIPFFALSVLTNYLAGMRLEEQHVQRMNQELLSKADDFDSEISRVYTGMKAHVLGGDEAFLATNYHLLSPYRLGKQVADIYEQLCELEQTSSYIRDVVVYMPGILRAVSIQKYYDDKISDEDLTRINRAITSGLSILCGDEGLRIYVSAPAAADTMPIYVMETTLSSAKIASHLNNRGDSEKFALAGPDWIMCEDSRESFQAAAEKIYLAKDDSGNWTDRDEIYHYRKLSLIDAYMISCTSTKELLAPVRNFQMLSVAALALAVLFSILICMELNKEIHAPFQELMKLFNQVENGQMNVQSVPAPGEFAMVFEQFQRMLERIRELISKSVEQEKALQRAEYRQLQSHIAPHFLYNSFNVLRHCILTGDGDTAEAMARHLGSYFRYLSYTDTQEDVSLLQEYQHVVDYLEIQKIRFQDNIHMTVDPLPQTYEKLRIPPFVLQPLVENTFKHGVKDLAYSGEITLTIRRQNEESRLTVRDNGAGMPQEQLRLLQSAMADGTNIAEHSGIVNTYRRLQYHGNGRIRMEVSSEENRYFEVSIYLPLKEEA